MARDFEDDFAITKAALSPQAKLDKIKAKHLIAKLRDPARSMIELLTLTEQNSFKAIVEHLRKWYLTESKKIRTMHELQETRQTTTESIQCFAVKIAKLVDRVSYEISDPTLVEQEKIKEFKYRVIPKFLAKLAPQRFNTFIDVVREALNLEQQATIKKDAEERAKLHEAKIQNSPNNDNLRQEPPAHLTSESKMESDGIVYSSASHNTKRKQSGKTAITTNKARRIPRRRNSPLPAKNSENVGEPETPEGFMRKPPSVV